MEIGEGELKQFSQAYDSPWHLTSAKTGKNVEDAFANLARRILEQRVAQNPPASR